MSKTKNSNVYNVKQLAMVAFVSAFVGVTVTAFASARQGNLAGGASIGGVSTCPGGVWTIDARSFSKNSALMNVDIIDDNGGSSTYRLLASDIHLDVNNPYTFQVLPRAGTQKETMYVVLHNPNSTASSVVPPAQEGILASARLLNPCL